MQTFEEYLEEKELNEGLKDIAKKFKKIMADFHASKDIDMGFDELKTSIDWVKSRVDGDKAKALDRFLKGIDQADLTTRQGRVKLGKLQKDFKPLLKSLNVGIKI